jgi:hypothetical protein
MRYNMSMSFGLDIRYRLDRYSSFILGLLSTQLKAVDKFSMQFIGTPAQLNAQNDVRLFSIEGKEQRFQALVGYRQGWMVNDQLDFFMQPMITLTGIKVVSNTAYIADRQYQLFIGAANPAQIQNYVPQTHVGMGGGIGMGFEFMLGNNHSTELCFTTTREKMQLWDYEVTGWNKTITAAFYY